MKKTEKPSSSLAYQVTYDDEGYADIVWATCTAAARREAMIEFGCEFTDVSTKRVPELDNFSGNIEEWKWNQGWRAPCGYLKCRNERVTEGDEGSVFHGHSFYCSTQHRDLELERERQEQATIDAAKRRVCARFPGIVIRKCFINVGGDVMMDVNIVMQSGTVIDGYTREQYLLEELK